MSDVALAELKAEVEQLRRDLNVPHPRMTTKAAANDLIAYCTANTAQDGLLPNNDKLAQGNPWVPKDRFCCVIM